MSKSKLTAKKKKPVAKKKAAKRKPATKKQLTQTRKTVTAKKKVAKKLAAKKPAAKKPAAKKPAAKKPATKKSPARKPIPKKKAIGFEMMKSYQTKIEKLFDTLQSLFDKTGESLNEYVYNGKKKHSTISRGLLMDIIKESKNLRVAIQESKSKLNPIYKD